MEITVANIVERWSGLERPLFKGKLIDAEGCKCAQGDVLSCAGWTDDMLRKLDQAKADTETAKLLGISITHSILLRQVNDDADGAPQIVLTNPEKVLGPHADLVLGLWLYFDALTADEIKVISREAWEARAARAAWEAREAWEAWAARAAWEARAAWAARAAWEAREAWAAWEAWEAWEASRYAAIEIIGMEKLIADKQEPYFLAFFGFDTWEKVREIGTLYPWRKASQ